MGDTIPHRAGASARRDRAHLSEDHGHNNERTLALGASLPERNRPRRRDRLNRPQPRQQAHTTS